MICLNDVLKRYIDHRGYSDKISLNDKQVSKLRLSERKSF